MNRPPEISFEERGDVLTTRCRVFLAEGGYIDFAYVLNISNLHPMVGGFFGKIFRSIGKGIKSIAKATGVAKILKTAKKALKNPVLSSVLGAPLGIPPGAISGAINGIDSLSAAVAAKHANLAGNKKAEETMKAWAVALEKKASIAPGEVQKKADQIYRIILGPADRQTEYKLILRPES